MKNRFLGLTAFGLVLCITLSGLLPLVSAQNFDIVSGGDDIVGGSGVFVFRKSRKAAHIKTSVTRKSGGRTVQEKVATRKAVLKKSQEIAKARPKPTPRKIDENALAALTKAGTRPTPKPVKGKPTPKPVVVTTDTLAKKAITREQKDALSDTLTASADIILKEGDIETAKTYYLDALELNPNNESAKISLSEIYTNEADKLFDADKFKAAQVLYEEAIKNDAKNAGAFAGLGDTFDALGEKDKSKTAYQKALEINPELTELFYPLGVLSYEAGDLIGAQKYFGKLAAANTKDPEVYNYLGLILAREGKQKEAIVQFNKAVNLDDKFAEGFHNLGDMFDKLDKDKEATIHFEKAIAIYETQTPKPARLAEAYYDLGVSLYNREKYREATISYEKALKINPNYYEALLNLADSYRQEKMFNEALGVYALAVRLGDKKPAQERSEVFGKYGYCAGKAKQWNLAVEMLRKAVELEADALDYANLGWALNNAAAISQNPQPLFAEAQVVLEKAAQMSPGFAPAKQNLGETYNLTGEFEKAIEVSSEAAEIYKRGKQTELQALALVSVGFAHRGLSEKQKKAGNQNASKESLKKSAEILREATKLNDRLSTAYFYLGVVESELGNIKEAQKALDKLRSMNSSLAYSMENILKRRAVENLEKKLKRRAVERIMRNY